MAFDCILIKFPQQKNNNVKEKFPMAKEISFTLSYLDMLKSYVHDIETRYFWFLSSEMDYSNFDFDFIPEKHQENQIHVWHNKHKKEGDTFLIPKKEFMEQMNDLRFLRDYRDINYHETNLKQLDCDSHKFTFEDLNNKISRQKEPYCHYYYDKKLPNFFPSYWDEQKIYVLDEDKTNIVVPRINIKKELYEHDKIVFQKQKILNTKFPVCFLHNNEPQAKTNLSLLKSHCERLSIAVREFSGIGNRTTAIKTAAEEIKEEYFFLVPAKIKIEQSFDFAFRPDPLKSNRHYIFDCYNPVLDYTYGHQAVVMYNRYLALSTSAKVLDFTLSQPHEHCKILSGSSTADSDDKVLFRTSFREIVKLLYNKNHKPTVELNFIIRKWRDCADPVVQKAFVMAVDFLNTHNFSFEEVIKTYEWAYVDKLFVESFV